MIISDFELITTKGKTVLDRIYIAEISVTEGLLWWKKTTRRRIRRHYAATWFFEDTGEFVPAIVNNLARAWTAKTEQEC